MVKLLGTPKLIEKYREINSTLKLEKKQLYYIYSWPEIKFSRY